MILPVKESLCPGFECFLEDLFWYSSRINMVQLKVLLPRGSPFQYSFPFIATRILLNIFIPIILIFIVNTMPPWSFDHDTITIFIITITVLVIMVIIFMATRIPRNYFGGKTASTRLFQQSSMISFHLLDALWQMPLKTSILFFEYFPKWNVIILDCRNSRVEAVLPPK